MKIKQIKLQNNKFFGNITFDFTDTAGMVLDNIILAGENGCGKTQLLDIIYDFSNLSTSGVVSPEVRTFTILLSEDELKEVTTNIDTDISLVAPTGIFIIAQGFLSQSGNSNQTAVQYQSTNEQGNIIMQEFETSFLYNTRKIFKSVFSTVEINYMSQSVSSVTGSEIDQIMEDSIRSEENLGAEVHQLLVDIKANDDSDLSTWVDENVNIAPSPEVKNIRINRFKKAFATMFDDLNFSKVISENSSKKVIFKKGQQDVPISALSSGEKQIVFRGAFLLRNQKSIKGNVILIDEPEISLHPKWQKKIFDYYRNLFVDENNVQTSQLFIATHSQYVLSSGLKNSDNTAIIVMGRSGEQLEINNITEPLLVLPSITVAELNYVSFGIVSNDYHIELYGLLQHKIAQSHNKEYCNVKECDTFIKSQKQYNVSIHGKESSFGNANYETLPTYIRNAIDHPAPEKKYTDDQLACSIKLLLELCR